ncbi:MAG: hypothetical protein NWE89_02685 [Candidatus Bathyarchaeota archaeon]|nr:hypothetical protein [Candidatus Bathyarchaeota archaeon]
MKYWLNIDKSSKTTKLHKDPCRFCKPHNQSNKGINGLKRLGGWFRFKTIAEAKTYHKNHHPEYLWHPCRICTKKLEANL